MQSGLVLWVDEQHVSERSVIEVNTGQVRVEKLSAKDLCQSLALAYKPMTQAIKELVLFERKAKDGQAPTLATLGERGPFVLVRVVDGQVANGFGTTNDFPKPMKVSAESLRDLALIFGGKKKTAGESK